MNDFNRETADHAYAMEEAHERQYEEEIEELDDEEDEELEDEEQDSVPDWNDYDYERSVQDAMQENQFYPEDSWG